MTTAPILKSLHDLADFILRLPATFRYLNSNLGAHDVGFQVHADPTDAQWGPRHLDYDDNTHEERNVVRSLRIHAAGSRGFYGRRVSPQELIDLIGASQLDARHEEILERGEAADIDDGHRAVGHGWAIDLLQPEPEPSPEWLTDGALAVGDYGGSGTVGEANQRALKEIAEDLGHEVLTLSYRAWERYREDRAWSDDEEVGDHRIVELYGSHGSRTLWVRGDVPEFKEVLDALSDYPLIDEEIHSQVEVEWEESAWERWVRADLLATLDDDAQEAAEGLDDGILFQAYRDALEACNEYPTHEHAGTYVDVARIADTFAELLAGQPEPEPEPDPTLVSFLQAVADCASDRFRGRSPLHAVLRRAGPGADRTTDAHLAGLTEESTDTVTERAWDGDDAPPIIRSREHYLALTDEGRALLSGVEPDPDSLDDEDVVVAVEPVAVEDIRAAGSFAELHKVEERLAADLRRHRDHLEAAETDAASYAATERHLEGLRVAQCVEVSEARHRIEHQAHLSWPESKRVTVRALLAAFRQANLADSPELRLGWQTGEQARTVCGLLAPAIEATIGADGEWIFGRWIDCGLDDSEISLFPAEHYLPTAD